MTGRGRTGQISLTSVCEAVAAGHKVTVFNRGKSSVAELPAGVTTIVGDIHDQETYAKLGASKFDVVCAFMVFKPEHIRQDIATFSGKVGQYVFISSASCYLKPVRHYIITEKTPLENPYWEYSRNKIACERLLQDQSKLRHVPDPSDTVPSGGVRLLGHRADLRMCGRDRRKKPANENRRRTIKNRGPSESEKVPFHKRTRGRELVFLLLRNLPYGQCTVKVTIVKGGIM